MFSEYTSWNYLEFRVDIWGNIQNICYIKELVNTWIDVNIDKICNHSYASQYLHLAIPSTKNHDMQNKS